LQRPIEPRACGMPDENIASPALKCGAQQIRAARSRREPATWLEPADEPKVGRVGARKRREVRVSLRPRPRELYPDVAFEEPGPGDIVSVVARAVIVGPRVADANSELRARENLRTDGVRPVVLETT